MHIVDQMTGSPGFWLVSLLSLLGCRRTEAENLQPEPPAPAQAPTPDLAAAAQKPARTDAAPPQHPALAHGVEQRSGGLRLISPHRTQPHQLQGSAHTHCAPDHSGIDAASQQRRLRSLGPDHRHDFVWMTAHNFVAPDPGQDGILHLFGTELYTKNQGERRAPHMVALLPDGRLADPEGRPFGVYELDVAGTARAVHRAGGLAVLAHPSRYSPSKESLLGADSTLWGIEVLSGRSRPEENAVFVDDRLSAGKYTCLSAGGDIHEEDYKLTSGYQVVDLPSREPSRDELFNAVRNCNFFACGVKSPSHGPIRRPSVELKEGAIHFSSRTILASVRFVGKGGRTLHEAKTTTSATYTPRAEDGYVRIEAVSSGQHARCYSQPIWVEAL